MDEILLAETQLHRKIKGSGWTRKLIGTEETLLDRNSNRRPHIDQYYSVIKLKEVDLVTTRYCLTETQLRLKDTNSKKKKRQNHLLCSCFGRSGRIESEIKAVPAPASSPHGWRGNWAAIAGCIKWMFVLSDCRQGVRVFSKVTNHCKISQLDVAEAVVDGFDQFQGQKKQHHHLAQPA